VNEGQDTSFGKTRVQAFKSSCHVKQAVYDGRDAVGIVELIDGAFIAVDTTGEIVGSFRTLSQAVRAFPAREGAR
jgi:hypothetical protein